MLVPGIADYLEGPAQHPLERGGIAIFIGYAAPDTITMAWPGFATVEDVGGLPPTVISVNECDPLRDEGISFHRLLMRAGVRASCRQVMGTIHATEIFPTCCPDISYATASDIANFCRR